MPRLAATANTGGSNVTVATNPISTAMAHAGPDVAKMFNVANVIDSKANATVAADARITRPIVAVAGRPRHRPRYPVVVARDSG